MPRTFGSLSAYEPGLMDQARWWLQDTLTPVMGGDARRAGDFVQNKVMPTAEYLPGVGDAMAAGEAVDYFKQGQPIFGTLAAAGAMAGLVPGVGDAVQKGVKRAVKAAENVRVMPLSVNDFHGGEAFGYKELRVDGNPMAAADVNVYGDEVSIRDIVTRPEARRKGYATKLVDDLFAEFPDKKIMITGTTPDGTAFFGNKYNVLPDGQITKKEVKPQGIRAYHGSPHDFDKFSLDKIGTGEGAQAYGHGLYFAEQEDVARQYREQLTAQAGVGGRGAVTTYLRDGVELPASQKAEIDIAQTMQEFGLDPSTEEGARWLRSEIGARNMSAPRDIDEQLVREIYASGPIEKNRQYGRMYEVNINADPNDFLDWDKPLSEQPENVRLAFERKAAIDRTNFDSSATGDELWKELTGSARNSRLFDKSGKSIAGGAPQETARQFAIDAGIPGIKYLDAGSRSAGDGSRNYVVFDDALIEILRKYGLAGLGIGVGAGGFGSLAPQDDNYQPPQL